MVKPEKKKPGRTSYRDMAKLPKYASHKVKVQHNANMAKADSVPKRLQTHVAGVIYDECNGGVVTRYYLPSHGKKFFQVSLYCSNKK